MLNWVKVKNQAEQCVRIDIEVKAVKTKVQRVQLGKNIGLVFDQ